MIFNTMMDFAHFVEERHMIDPPITLTYSNIVSCDSIHITVLLAALNFLYVVFVSLICLKCSGDALRAHLANALHTLGIQFKSGIT